MSITALGFQFEEAVKNIRRNGLMSLAALTTITFSMAVLGGALWTLYRVHQFVSAQPRQFEIAVFIDHNLSRDKSVEVQNRLVGMPEVERVNLYTREQALTALQSQDLSQNTGIAAEETLDSNPLPDRLDVRLRDPAQTRKFAAMLRDHNAFPEIENVRDELSTLEKLMAASRLVRTIGITAAILLFLATAFVIQNTIRLTVFARRREIRIMQLVGATPAFIRFPLVLEGIFYGVLGAAAAAGIVLFAVRQISIFAGKFESPIAQTMPPAIGALSVLGLMVGIGAVVGWAGSVLSIRRFLRRI